MKKLLSLLALCLPFALIAQESSTGVRFENFPNWASVKEKAKQENKFIFVDCFATWCGPCKLMDKNVYPLDSVGKYLGEHYISIKVQMDSGKTDNENVKAWYADARSIAGEYKIDAYPSFLYFSPDGQLVHKARGYQAPDIFVTIARDALDPKKQYYTLKEAFLKGQVSLEDMPNLAITARELNDQDFATSVGKTYINKYLLRLPENELTAQNLRFMFNFTNSSSDQSFKIFYKKADQVNKVVNDSNFSRVLVDFIVEKEEINPNIYKDNRPVPNTPDWAAIQRSIKKKYDQEFADRIVLWAKIKWFANKRDWPAYCKSVIEKVEKYGPYRNFAPYATFPMNLRWNSAAWDLFLHSSDTNDLKKALEWSAKSLDEPKPEGMFFDTYANILHKLGRDAEALPYEAKAVAMDPNDKEKQANFEKMKKGEPTWPTR